VLALPEESSQQCLVAAETAVFKANAQQHSAYSTVTLITALDIRLQNCCVTVPGWLRERQATAHHKNRLQSLQKRLWTEPCTRASKSDA
jgi:hypothetical protein